jgi:S-formylglutathione hydrolase FrmB
VSSHSGILSGAPLTADLAVSTAFETDHHFGSNPGRVLAAVDPTLLVQAGAFDQEPPRIWVDVGLEDGVAKGQALRFSELLTSRDIENQATIWGRPDKKLGHNWETWSAVLERWIAFHQSAFGDAGEAHASVALDVTNHVRREQRERAERLARAEERSGFLSWF